MSRALHRVWPYALVLVAFALRVHRLGDKNIWWDEGLAIWAVRKPLVDATLWTAGDVHPPLYFWLLWGWIRLVGQTEFAARALTMAIGVLIAAVAYAIGRRVGGRRSGKVAGGLAVLFVGVARFEVWWSMELRMYALAGLAIALAVYATLRWMSGVPTDDAEAGEGATSTRRWLVGYVVAGCAALYTVYMAGAALVALNVVVVGALVWLAVGGMRRRTAPRALAEWAAAQVAVLLLVVPWLAVALPRMQSWTSIRGEPAAPRFVAELWATLLATGVSTDLASVRGWTVLFWAAAFVVPAALLAGWRLARRGGRRGPDAMLGPDAMRGPEPSGAAGIGQALDVSSNAGAEERKAPVRQERRSAVSGWHGRVAALILLLFAVFPPVIVWAATQPRSLFYSPAVEARYLVPFAAPVYVLAAWAIARVWRRSAPVGSIILLGALLPMIATTTDYYGERRLRDLYQTMALAIWSQSEPGDAVVLLSGNRYPIFQYYYDQPWVQPAGAQPYELPADSPPDWEARPTVIPFPDRGTEPVAAGDWPAALEEVTRDHDRVWLVEVESHLQDPDGLVKDWLDERWPLVLSEAYGPDTLHLFASDGEAPELTALSRRFPGTVGVRSAIDGMKPSAGLAELLPVAGLPALRALPGDTPSLTLFTTSSDSGGYPAAVEAYPAWSRDLAPLLQESGGRVRVALPVTARTPDGAQPLTVTGQSGGLLEAIAVVGAEPATASTAIDADFGFADLTGAGLTADHVRPGDSVAVDLYFWWPSEELRRPVPETAVLALRDVVPDPPPAVFVHLVGAPRPDSVDTVLAGGQDGPPSSGGWLERGSGLPIFDRQVLTIPDDATPGVYRIVVGMYDPVTGERLEVSGSSADAESRSVTVGELEVR